MMKANFDGHVHTAASDGLFPAEEVLRRASAAGIRCLAITDHDRTNPDCLAQSRQSGVTVVSGAEITARAHLPGLQPFTVHLCAYFIDPLDGPLNRLLAANRSGGGQVYLRAVLEKLDDLGIPISLKEVLAGGQGHVSRKNIARIMVRKGYVGSVQDAFRIYLGGSRPGDQKLAYVDRSAYFSFASMEDVVRHVTAAHGLVSLAHPLLYGLDDTGLRRLTAAFARCAGRAGCLECHRPACSPRQRLALTRLAEAFDLLPTAGSDYHGEPEDRFLPGPPAIYHDLLRQAADLYGALGEYGGAL